MDPITAGFAIAKFALPALGKWIFGDDGEAVANEVVDVAQKVTGAKDPQQALTMLQQNPEMVLEFQRQAQQIQIKLIEAETEQLRQVNETIRAEYTSDDKYVKRWRPTFGYVMAFTWAVQICGTVGGILYAIMAQPSNAGEILTAVGQVNAAMVTMWAVGLSVIGVSVWKRSDDKKLAAGQSSGLGIVEAIASRIAVPGKS